MKTLSDDIGRLIKATYNPNEGERNNAAGLLYRALIRLGVHPDDLQISVGNSSIDNLTELNRFYQDRLTKAVREYEYWRRLAKPEDLKRALRSAEVDYRFPDLEDLARDRLTGDSEDGPLSKGWKKKLCYALHINANTLKRWEQGVEQIPDSAFDILNRLPAAPKPDAPIKSGRNTKPNGDATKGRSRSTPKQPKSEDDKFPWADEEINKILVDGFAKGWTWDAIAEAIAAHAGRPCTFNMVVSRIYNNPPRYRLPVQAPDSSGPITWVEAWEIGGRLWGGGWISPLKNSLGIRNSPPQPLDPPPDKVRLLRLQYQEWVAEDQPR